MACVAARTDDEHGVSAYLKLFCKKGRSYEQHGNMRKPKQKDRGRERSWRKLATVRWCSAVMATWPRWLSVERAIATARAQAKGLRRRARARRCYGRKLSGGGAKATANFAGALRSPAASRKGKRGERQPARLFNSGVKRLGLPPPERARQAGSCVPTRAKAALEGGGRR